LLRQPCHCKSGVPAYGGTFSGCHLPEFSCKQREMRHTAPIGQNIDFWPIGDNAGLRQLRAAF